VEKGELPRGVVEGLRVCDGVVDYSFGVAGVVRDLFAEVDCSVSIP
jgi:hypothetical protein